MKVKMKIGADYFGTLNGFYFHDADYRKLRTFYRYKFKLNELKTLTKQVQTEYNELTKYFITGRL